jgi:hypothetical protein
MVEKFEQNPLESFEAIRENFVAQFDSQIRILTEAGLLYEGQMADGAGNTYPHPNPDDIVALLEKKREFFRMKYHQGFTRLLVAPMGTPLAYFFDAYSGVVQKHRSLGTLKDSKGDAVQEPAYNGAEVWAWDSLREADEKNLLKYFPSRFSENPDDDGAVTKAGLAPFRIVLVEDLANIPLQGKGRAVGGDKNEMRRQFETNRTPDEYIEAMLWNRHHEGESGFTPEIGIVDAITRLEEGQGLTDDRTATYHLGTYLMPDRFVTYSHWDDSRSRAVIGANEPTSHDCNFGARSAVVIE